MKYIPFTEAFRLLDAAHQLEIAGEPVSLVSSSLFQVGDPEDPFLHLDADNFDDYSFAWDFRQADNLAVAVEGDLMTLVTMATDDNPAGTLQLQLLMPVNLEHPPQKAKDALLYALINHHEGAGEFEETIIAGLKSLGVEFDERGNVTKA